MIDTGRFPYDATPAKELADRLSSSRLQLPRDQIKIDDLCYQFALQYLMEFIGVPRADMQTAKKEKQPRLLRHPRITSGRTHEEIESILMNADVLTTAAIIREIIFSDKEISSDEAGNFWACDLGSGTGILTAANAIALRRSPHWTRRTKSFGFEQHAGITRSSTELCNRVFPDRECHFVNVDLLTNQDVWESINRMGCPAIWTSETFSTLTPEFLVDSRTGRVRFINRGREYEYYNERGRDLDPLPELIALSSEFIPAMLQRTRCGQTWMFPSGFQFNDAPFDPGHKEIHIPFQTLNGELVPVSRIHELFSRFRPYLPINRFRMNDESIPGSIEWITAATLSRIC